MHNLPFITPTGTKNIINLCIKHNVPRLIYTSSASVTLTSYMGFAPFAVVVNLTESKVKAVTSDNEILVPGYSVTKYRAEKIVLGASGCNLANGTGKKKISQLKRTVYSRRIAVNWFRNFTPYLHSDLC